MNNKKTVLVLITIIFGVVLVTASVAFSKPSINKTVILQIQKYVNK